MKEIRQKVAQILGLPQEQVAIATNPTKWEKEEEGKTFFSDETTLEEAKVTNGQPMLFGIKNLEKNAFDPITKSYPFNVTVPEEETVEPK